VKINAFGRTNLKVSGIGLGCVTFGREIDDSAAFRIMDHAFESGITLFDTAESYGGGEAWEYRRKVFGTEDVREVSQEYHSSERIIGDWLNAKRCRKKIVLQTKISSNFTVRHLTKALDASLQRLRTDWIDVYLLHSFDWSTPIDDSIEALHRAVSAGKVRVIGCSNFSTEQLRQFVQASESSGSTRFEVVQDNYNLVIRTIEQELIPYCMQNQIAVTTYSPLGGGFLSGKYLPMAQSVPKHSRFDVIPGHLEYYFNDKGFTVLNQLRTKSEITRVPMAQLALAWVLHNPDLTSVLVGATATSHIDNAMKAQRMDLPSDWISEMDIRY